MKVKVQNRDDPSIVIIYNDVSSIQEEFDENGLICNQIVMMNGETATFPKMDWKVFYQGWIEW